MSTSPKAFNLVTENLRSAPRDRYDAGRAQRELVPLEVHVDFEMRTRGEDPLEILAQQDELRVPELVPLRYGRMSRTPFTYLRGAAAVMASDLAACPPTDLYVELCGDAHLGNFRWYHAPNRDLVFDLNDFDETLPGPFEWDVMRLAASIAVAGRNNGFSRKQCRKVTRAALRAYRRFIGEASELGPLNVHYYRFDADAAVERVKARGQKHRKWIERVLNRATNRNSMRAMEKLTEVVDGHRMIVPDPPVVVRVDDLMGDVDAGPAAAFFEQYRESLPLERRVLIDRFSLVDVAQKVVGVGSVGTRCLVMLLEAGDGTPLVMQFKQAVASVLERHLESSVFEQSGQRVVEGQRLIQATSDVLLGWARWSDDQGPDVDFYFRQLWDGKGKIDVEQLDRVRMGLFVKMCGKALAFCHARSGDAMMIRGYIGEDETFDDVMVAFADRYADVTERDHAQLRDAIDDGAIEVVRDL